MVSSLITKAKQQNNTPKVVKGSHLTVTTYPDGRTELEWDDEALLRDVRMALLKAESNIPVSTEDKPSKKKAAPKKAKVEEPKVVEKPKTKRKTKETK